MEVVHPPSSPRRYLPPAVGVEVVLVDVARDPREVLGGLRHRGAVVEAAPDPRVLDVLHELLELHVGPRRSRGGAGHRHLEPLRAEVLLQRLRQAGREAGMPGRVLRVVARDERQPGRVLRRRRVAVGVGPLDRVVRSPEHEVVLGFPARDHRVCDRDPGVPEESCRLAHVEIALVGEPAQRPAVLDVRRVGEEADGLRLRRRPCRARVAAQRHQLGHVVGVLLGRQRVRRVGSIGRPLVRERAHLPELHVDRRRRLRSARTRPARESAGRTGRRRRSGHPSAMRPCRLPRPHPRPCRRPSLARPGSSP